MNRHRQSWRSVLLGVALAVVVPAIGGVSVAFAQSEAPKPNTIRPEIAAPVKAAEELMAAKKFPEALAKLREADGVADRTAWENYVIERLRGIAAANAGDMPASLKSFEAVVASGFAPPAEQIKLIEGLARMYFRTADYPKASFWASRYLKDGGTDPQMRLLRARSLYLAGEFAPAATELRSLVDADEKKGVPSPLEQLQLLGTCYVKLNDNAGYSFVLEKLLTYYPKKEYWADAIRRVETRPGFADSLGLDVLRLQEATGNLTSVEQYSMMTQLLLKSSYPAEAKRIVDQGFASGVLGAGPDADFHRQLRDTATKQVLEDEKMLAQNAKDASAAKDGHPMVIVGYALVSAGQFDKGLALMEQGIQKGVAVRPEDAKLHLAIAYLAAGQKAKAIAAFKAVQGADGTADLARLWLIHAQRSSS